MSKVVGGVGPAVLDQRVVAEPLLFVSGGKADVRIEDSLGGGCLNALKAAAAQGAAVLPVLLVGRDPLRRLLEVLVRQQFPQSLLLSMLRETRRSVLCGDSTVTVRSDMVCQRLPDSTQQRLRAADLVLMAPMTEVDTQFVGNRPAKCMLRGWVPSGFFREGHLWASIIRRSSGRRGFVSSGILS